MAANPCLSTQGWDDSGYSKIFPDSKPEDRLTWSKYRNDAVAWILKAQNKDGNWGKGAAQLPATALYLSILQMEDGALPMPQR